MKGSARFAPESEGHPLGEAVPLPTDIFPSRVRDFVRFTADAMPCPPDFVGVSTLAAAGAAIGTTHEFEVKEGYLEAANLTLAIVGRPGSKKSPAIRSTVEPCFNHHAHCHRRYREQREVAREHGKTEPPFPPEYVLTDATMEALGSALEGNSRGLLYFQDELAAWIKGMNQYRSGAKGNDRQAWLSLFDRVPMSIKRKGKPNILIERPFVSIIGGIQPDVLDELSSGRADGFLERLLFAYPKPTPYRRSEKTVPTQVREAYHETIAKLYNLAHKVDSEPVLLRASKAATERRNDWLDKHYQEMNEDSFPSYLEGLWAKTPGLSARLALILELLYHASEGSTPSEISIRSMCGGLRLTDYFQSHARRVYRHLYASKQERSLDRLRDWLGQRGRKEISVRDICRAKLPGLGKAGEVKLALYELKGLGVGRLVEAKKLSGQRSQIFKLTRATPDSSP